MASTKHRKSPKTKVKLPIKYWSYSSLMSFLRNPLAWYKRYVELVYDTPSTPSSFVGRAGHKALEHFYQGFDKQQAIQMGLEYLRTVSDFEIEFGRAKTKKAKHTMRETMEREYVQAINFYLAKPPRHKVLGVEVKGVVEVEGLPLPLKAVSDLVVEARGASGMVDIVDHKFVAFFSKNKGAKALFIIQAIFNYYMVRNLFGKPVRKFIVYECKKSKNADGRPQLRKYEINYADCREEFVLFHRLVRDATAEIARPRAYLPNPSDMFEGENSFEIYRLSLVDEFIELPEAPSQSPASLRRRGTRR